MALPIRTSSPLTGQPGAVRRLRLSLSLTDVLFLLVMGMLVATHLRRLTAGSPLSLLFVVQQMTVILFTLLHRAPRSAPAPWQDVVLAWAGTLLPLAMQPNGQAPNLAGSLLVLVGVVLATGAVVSLGRSFGLEAVNRGVQTRGFYRFVRHPIYAAYLPLTLGYLLAFPSWFNVAVLVAWLACQVRRIGREEAVLGQDAEYERYAERVMWRLLPHVW